MRALLMMALAVAVAGAVGKREPPSDAAGLGSDRPHLRVEIRAFAETEAVVTDDDAADDAAVWVDTRDPSRSRIVGTDKRRGLIVYDLNGRTVQRLDHGRMNNIDARAGFEIGGRERTIVCASNRSDQTIVVYAVDEARGILEAEPVGRIATGLDEVYGLCMSMDRAQRTWDVFVGNKGGMVEQWRLASTPDGRVEARLVRRLEIGSQSEGMAGDDATGRVFIAEERGVIWAYDVDPASGDRRELVASVEGGAPLTPDVEGLSVYRDPDSPVRGVLVASSQGSDEFVLFSLEKGFPVIGVVRIVGGTKIDPVTHTDGIHAEAADLGPGLERGVLVVQDDENEGGQNFKIVSWKDLESSLASQRNWRRTPGAGVEGGSE